MRDARVRGNEELIAECANLFSALRTKSFSGSGSNNMDG